MNRRIEGEQLPLVALGEGQKDFRVLSIDTRTMTHGRVGSMGQLLTMHVESLVKSEEEIAETEGSFIDTTQRLISANIEATAVVLSPGSEITPILDRDDLMEEFKARLAELEALDYDQERINRLVKEQAGLFSGIAPGHMGALPSPVRSSLVKVSKLVDMYFEEKEAVNLNS